MDHGHDMNESGMSPQSSLVQPPADVLSKVIPPGVREKWRANPTEHLIRRLEYLCASGPRPSDALAAMRMVPRRAVRAAWETYVYSAYACGFFTGHKGKDLRGRLASSDPENFRSAMAECMACWFLAGRLRLPVSGDARGRGKKILDMRTVIGGQDVGVEVKAPYRECPSDGQPWFGHDGDLIKKALDAANKQFADKVPNILVLAPEFRTPVHELRQQLVSPLYGEEKITCTIDTRTGTPAGPVTTEFSPEGKLLRTRQPNGAKIKPTGKPGFTRVSAIVVIEEVIREKCFPPIRGWVDHKVLVAHNLHAARPLSPEIFREYVQFTDVGKGYGWSDGAPL